MMNKDDHSAVRITVLGTRGSIPVSDIRMRIFGGSTSAYMIEAGGESLLFDAGTGLMNLTRAMLPSDTVRLFLTHTHIDHILGLPLFLAGPCRGKTLHIYGRTRGGLSVREQIACFLHPPLWPAELTAYAGVTLHFHELDDSPAGTVLPKESTAGSSAAEVRPGRFSVRWMESRHPGGSLIFRVGAAGRSVVLATDYEHGSEPDTNADPALAAFAADADLLLYDSQYTAAQMPERRGFGHSTEKAGLRLLQCSGARSIRFIHHDPQMTDSALLEREAAALEYWSGICGIKAAEAADLPAFAREGETILL